MGNYGLFRIEVFQMQMDILDRWPSSSFVLSESLKEESLVRTLKTRQYFSAQKILIDENTYHFQMARKRTVTTSNYDGTVFRDEEHLDFPHIDIVIDCDNSLCAIAKNGDFSKSIDNSAKLLKKLLLTTNTMRHYKPSIVISPIINPEKFISQLQDSQIITKFYFDVKRPNIFEDNDIIPAMKQYTEYANGHKTRSSTTGLNLNKERLIDLVNKSASEGNDAGATFKPSNKKGLIRSSLGKNFIQFQWPESIAENSAGFLKKIRKLLSDIRDD